MKKTLLVPCILFLCYIAVNAQGVWTQQQDLPVIVSGSPIGTYGTFTIGSVAYVYTGAASNNFYAYDTTSLTWTGLADFPGAVRKGAINFAIGNYGYIGGGATSYTSPALYDFYQYDPSADAWTAMANYPDTTLAPFSFAINGTGFAGGGFNTVTSNTASHIYKYSSSYYAYDPKGNTWILKGSIPITGVDAYASASTSTKGYVTLGYGGILDLSQTTTWEYDPSSNTWTPKANYHGTFPFSSYPNSASCMIGTKWYIPDNNSDTVWIYNTVANTWSFDTLAPYVKTYENHNDVYAGFAIGNSAYFLSDAQLWKLYPDLTFSVVSFSPDTICEGGLLTVTIASNIAFDSSNYFEVVFESPGSGIYGGVSSPISSNQSTFTVQVPTGMFDDITTPQQMPFYVIAFDPNVQTAGFLDYVTVKPGAKVSKYLGEEQFICAGATATLNPGGGYAGQTYAWYLLPQANVLSTQQSIGVAPEQSSSYELISTFPPTGCTIDDTVAVIVNPLPFININDTSLLVCSGQSVSLGASPATNCVYQWSDYNGVISNSSTITVQVLNYDSYTVIATDTFSGCQDTATITAELKQAPDQELCIVTVDSNSTHNIVVWEKADKFATDSFYLYRETATDVYTLIASFGQDDLSEFDDFGANPNTSSYRYAISVNDTCGNVGYQSNYHNTMHLQYLGAGNLQWNGYEIENENTPVSTYDIYRDSLGNGSWNLWQSLPGTQTSITDPNFSANPNAKYRVQANFTYSCTPQRSFSAAFSNVITQTVSGISELNNETNISLSPNPSSGIVTLNIFNNTEPEMEIKVVSLLGQTLYSQTVSDVHTTGTYSLDFSTISKGIYFLTVQSKQYSVIKRLELF